jgi:CBS domain-containing protein
MNVGSLCQRRPVTAKPFDDLIVVSRLMREEHVGCVIVVEPAVRESAFKPVGVVTDRDLVVAVLAKGVDPKALQVSDVMTREPVVAYEEESAGAALRKMRKIGVRRLPVVGQQEELIGVISLDDIIDKLVSELEDAAGSVRSEQLVEHALRP